MKLSPYAVQKNKELEQKAIELYKTGLSTRKVGAEIGRSYQWVWVRVKHLMNEESTQV